MTRTVFRALAAIALFVPAAAQTGTPEAAAEAYFAAMTEGEIGRMAGMMHPEALSAFRGILQPVVDLAEKSEGGAGEVLQLFDGITTTKDLRRLDDTKFFASFFAGMSTLQPELLDAMRGAETETVGHVMEGADTAHVIYRMTMQVGATVTQTEVISLRRTKDGWGVLLSGEMEGLAESLRSAFEQQQ